MSGVIERIVVALDAASDSRAAIGTAARLAGRWKVRLHAVFVEDDDLIRLASLPFARQVTLGFGAERLTLQQAERELRAFAERARDELAASARRHGVEWSFEIVRGPAAEAVAAAASDLLVAGMTTRPIGRHFRIEYRWWSVGRPGPVHCLLTHREWHPSGGVAALLRDRGPAAERLLAAAARIAEASDAKLAIFHLPEAGSPGELAAWLDSRLAGFALGVELIAAPADVEALAGRLARLDCRLVALAADTEEARPEQLRRLVAAASCDVLVVR